MNDSVVHSVRTAKQMDIAQHVHYVAEQLRGNPKSINDTIKRKNILLFHSHSAEARSKKNKKKVQFSKKIAIYFPDYT